MSWQECDPLAGPNPGVCGDDEDKHKAPIPVAFICCLHLPPAAAAGSGGPDRVHTRDAIPVPRTGCYIYFVERLEICSHPL